MEDREEWRAFLEARGTLHIIADLGRKPRRFTDLEERVPISSSTLDRRVKEGLQLGAWELDRIVEEDADRRVYRLDSGGQRVYDVMERNGSVEASREARRQLDALDEVRQLILSRISD